MPATGGMLKGRGALVDTGALERPVQLSIPDGPVPVPRNRAGSEPLVQILEPAGRYGDVVTLFDSSIPGFAHPPSLFWIGGQLHDRCRQRRDVARLYEVSVLLFRDKLLRPAGIGSDDGPACRHALEDHETARLWIDGSVDDDVHGGEQRLDRFDVPGQVESIALVGRVNQLLHLIKISAGSV